MSNLVELRCPNCGAPLKVVGDSPSIECSFCGTVVMIPAELRHPPQPVTMPPPNPQGFASPVDFSTSRTAPVRKRASLGGCLGLVVVLLVILGINALIPNRDRSIPLTSGLLPRLTPTVLSIQRNLTSTLPRQINYAGLSIQITQGVIDNRQERNDELINLPDEAFARLDGTLQNVTRESLYLDAKLFKLRMGDGQLYSLDPGIVLSKNFSAPDPGASNKVSLVFPVPFNAEWAGATLVVTDGTGEPAELPLTGDLPKATYPLALSLPAKVTVDADGITYQVKKAALNLDASSKRAEKGTRFLFLDLHMTNPTGQYGVNISSDDFRVIVDGASSAPVEFPIEVINYQSSIDRQVVFAIPVSAQSVQVQFGNVRADPPNFALITFELQP
jgi:hypothetical protein